MIQQVLTATRMKMAVFQDFAPCNVVDIGPIFQRTLLPLPSQKTAIFKAMSKYKFCRLDVTT